MLSPNPFSFVYASGSLLRQYLNPSIIAAQNDPYWIPLATALNSKYFSTGADASSTQPVTKVNWSTAICAFVMFSLTLVAALLNGECGPGLPRSLRLRRALEAPPMDAQEAPTSAEFDVNGKGEPSLRAVMIELREVKTLLQARGGAGGDDGGGGLFSGLHQTLKLPSWNLGGGSAAVAAPAAPAAPAVPSGGAERGRRVVPPQAAPSTAQMGGVCGPAQQQQPPERERRSREPRSRSKPRRADDAYDRDAYFNGR